VLNQGALTPSAFGEFVFTPLQAGVLERDSGTMTSVWRRVVFRNGHRLETYDAVSTLKGRRGSLVLRERVEWLDAGDGYHPGRAIRQLAGRGPGAIVWLADVPAGHPVRDSEAAAHAPSGGLGHPGGLAAVSGDTLMPAAIRNLHRG
jgi:hypothetical protein